MALVARPSLQRLQISPATSARQLLSGFLLRSGGVDIELDGSQHGFPDQRKHDLEREKFLQARGIKTLRFWNSRLRRNAKVVRDTIFNELQSRAPQPLPDYAKPMRAGDKS